MSKDKFNIIIILIMVLAIIGITILKYNNVSEYSVLVVDKRVKNDLYLIYTKLEDGESRVFQNSDLIFRGKFNSADIYAEIDIGEEYIFTVQGFRVPILSWYENIITVKSKMSE